MRLASSLGLPLLLFAAALLHASPLKQDVDAVDFGRDIQPIFEARCLKCHGEKKQKAGLRLDSRTAAIAGSDFGARAVILPGNAAESLLFQMVNEDDEDERMPPSGDPLSAEQLGLIERWINEGAPWTDDNASGELFSEHWSYIAPREPLVPQPQGADWARNEIDLFVLQRMQAEGLQPSPEAKKSTLLRRLCLDLTGLPPTPEQIQRFGQDDSPLAYEDLVERLLASPHYGERQARAWLDLARYADTNGYEKDSRRTMWRYRDWVIQAFNDDLGFDRFTIEQLAGDLLPDATLEQRTATGFHRNTMINAEGGVDAEEYRVEAVVDRVNTTASVWLGSTLACARCHTHKYDPFSHRDYYRLFAYFNSSTDTGPGDGPKISAPTKQQAQAEERSLLQLAKVQQQLSGWTPELEQELQALEANYRSQREDWSLLRPTSFTSQEGATLALLNEGSILALGDLPPSDTYEFTFELEAQELHRLRIDVLPHQSLPNGGSARSQHQNFVLSEVELELLTDAQDPQPLAVQVARADYHQTGSPNWPAQGSVDGNPSTGWAIGGDVNVAHQLVLELEAPLVAKSGARLRVRLAQLYGGSHLIGHVRFSASGEKGTGLKPIRADMERLLVRTPQITEEERVALRLWFLESTPSLEKARAQKLRLDMRPKLPSTLVMQELESPRETRILERGSFLSPGVVVEAGVPMVLPQQPLDAEANRLSLARWLVSPDNPLTARVTVNRLWDQVFGLGLVTTTEDFGTQGEAPSHPQLLDWLALSFQREDWSTKSLLRQFVLSATYRQRSLASPELRDKDPQNRWLARGSRYRVEAEMVRDIALVASGLLTDTIGGPSVFPPQPDGVWKMAYSNDRWVTATDEDRYRRGLYTFWRRTAPYPAFMAFGATSRELACVRRPGSNTPLQALALLNDPAFVETAVALAGRLLTEGGATDKARIDLGFLLCTGRHPEASEVQIMIQLLQSQRDHYAGLPAAADELIQSDGPSMTAELDHIELAAWSILANVLLNLDETITRS